MKNDVIITDHALRRAKEAKLTETQLKAAWHRSICHHLSRKQEIYKFKKYGIESTKIRYYWDEKEGVLFTVKVDSKFVKGERIEEWILITITKGKGNLKGGSI